MNHLVVNNLSKSYSKDLILQNLNLQLQEGEIACLIGPSGVGKSSLLRCIAGLEDFEAGEIIFQNRVIANNKYSLPPYKREIAFVFQNYALFPHMSVYENLDFFLMKTAMDRKKKILEILDLFNLTSEIDKYPDQLSGGQQQRVAVARSLIQQPKLLLMDEPFANIDYELRKKLVHETRQIIKRFGISAIIVCHDKEDAFDLSDKVAVLLNKTILQWDTPYNIYHEPKTMEVAHLLGPSVFLDVEVTPNECLNLGRHHLCGDLHKKTSKSLSPGDVVKLLVRPDDILHNDKSRLKAKVINRYFRGAYHMYELELDGKYRFHSFVPSHHNHNVGEYIGIEFEVEHLVCF